VRLSGLTSERVRHRLGLEIVGSAEECGRTASSLVMNGNCSHAFSCDNNSKVIWLKSTEPSILKCSELVKKN